MPDSDEADPAPAQAPAEGAVQITPLGGGGTWSTIGTVSAATTNSITIGPGPYYYSTSLLNTYATGSTVTFNNNYAISLLYDDAWHRAREQSWTVQPAPEPDPVERERRQREHAAQVARRRAEQQAQDRERETARGRARELLVSYLDAAQRRDYEQRREFTVIGSAGTRFRIGPGVVGNIGVCGTDGGTPFARICAHPERPLPEPDMHLAQMFALMTDERAFVARANLQEGVPVGYDGSGRVIDPRDRPDDVMEIDEDIIVEDANPCVITTRPMRPPAHSRAGWRQGMLRR